MSGKGGHTPGPWRVGHETELIAALLPFAAIEECHHGIMVGLDTVNTDHAGECEQARQILAARAAIAKAEGRA